MSWSFNVICIVIDVVAMVLLLLLFLLLLLLLYRETVWKLLRHYGVPKKIISLIRCTFQDMSCKIAHAGQLTESFEVKTGVRQGCLLSPFLFLLVIDWIMKTTTTGRNNSIQWTLWTQLDDLDFSDDLALLSHNHSQM